MGIKDATRETYRDAPGSGGAAAERKLDADARRAQGGTVMSYLGPDGSALAVTGDEEAPFVKVAIDAPALVLASDLPQAGQEPPPVNTGVLHALEQPGELHEAWAIDARDPSAPGFALRWLMLFDVIDTPASGDIPQVQGVPIAALPLCRLASYNFVQVPVFFARGICLVLSTTPNFYTPIAQATDYAISARVLATKE